MPDSLLSDSALRATEFALDGLTLRQQVIGRNLANVDTPGYKAQTVSFEAALQQAQQDTTTGPAKLALTATHANHLKPVETPPAGPLIQISTRSGGSIRADGNTVDAEQELLQMTETGVRYQALAQMTSKKLMLLKTIITGR